jgi:hypothetical protein
MTETWPLPHTEESWYFAPGGGLTRTQPREPGADSYRYDPNDPIRILSGPRLPAHVHGPRDHSVLRDRADILRYTSEPFTAPVEITGEARVELCFSSDAPDTCFVVTVVDIYPDGFEWPIRDTALMARYHRGLEKPEPLVAGEVCQATLPLVSTALVIDKGHRLGVRISSSSYPAYVVHPNTWEAISSYTEARVAHQRIHTGGRRASRLVLPVIRPGVSVDYDPRAAH